MKLLNQVIKAMNELIEFLNKAFVPNSINTNKETKSSFKGEYEEKVKNALETFELIKRIEDELRKHKEKRVLDTTYGES